LQLSQDISDKVTNHEKAIFPQVGNLIKLGNVGL
jgi:hypothetical protein